MNQKVQALLKAKFGRVKTVSGGSFRVPCPTCDPTHSKKMKRYLSPGWATSRCFICEKSIPIHELLGERISFERAAGEIDDTVYPYATIAPYQYCESLESLSSDHPVIAFLNKDHLHNYAYYDSLGIRYIPEGGGANISFDSGFTVNTSSSLFFPVFGKTTEYVGWQVRFIPGTWNGDRFQFMRYMHLFPKGDHLYNYHTAKQYNSVIVVEGVKKALKLANSVATLGKGISDKQKQLIQEWKHIVLILDGEDAAQDLARELQREFTSNGRRCVNIDLRKHGFASPDETTSQELKSIIQRECAVC
jgi:5S rRNA maturation endonuclease (ribonuclease M5)